MAQPPTRLKRGDRSPIFDSVMRDRDGNPISLLGATARFLMRDATDRSNVVIVAPATIVNPLAVAPDPDLGRITYSWSATDTVTPGKFEAEVEVTFAGGIVETFPNVGYHDVIIEQDIA
ncbi:hypothetical protein LCGC14_0273720 [marine sediment metagenome]|uniref:BppU N-terminal domain-containing protein n=2 Tax=root TaxID=1 RepID=A0A9C9NJ66_9HYPH|nr:hypothetical protein [Aurantimonas coralicida]